MCANLNELSNDDLQHKIECCMGSYESLDPDSEISKTIGKCQTALTERGQSQYVPSQVYPSNAGGPPSD